MKPTSYLHQCKDKQIHSKILTYRCGNNDAIYLITTLKHKIINIMSFQSPHTQHFSTYTVFSFFMPQTVHTKQKQSTHPTFRLIQNDLYIFKQHAIMRQDSRGGHLPIVHIFLLILTKQFSISWFFWVVWWDIPEPTCMFFSLLVSLVLTLSQVNSTSPTASVSELWRDGDWRGEGEVVVRAARVSRRPVSKGFLRASSSRACCHSKGVGKGWIEVKVRWVEVGVRWSVSEVRG